MYGYSGYVGCIGFNPNLKIEEVTDPIKLEHLSPALLNNPLSPSQLYVLNADECQFNQEALDILSKVKRGNNDIGDIDLFKTDEGKKIISWLGGPLALISSQSEGSNLYDYEVIKSIKPVEIEKNERVQDFINYIENSYNR